MQISFDTVSYCGSFRKDQTVFLEKVYGRMRNGKIHVVTPPGSDKRALGLELLRHEKAPALILTVSDAFCKQWYDEFVTNFLPTSEQAQRDAYVSLSLVSPTLITVLTYEALAAAFSQTGSRITGSEGGIKPDIVRYVHACGIRTILLEDPHHMTDALFGILESFFNVLGKEVHVLTMNSVLPCDLCAVEWNRFAALCGEVDAELSLPNLVKEGVLCPHRDYLYKDFPTETESEALMDYRLRTDRAVMDVMALPFVAEIHHRLIMLCQKRVDYPDQHRSALAALLCLLTEYGHTVSKKMVKVMYGCRRMPTLTPALAEEALQFLLDSHSILASSERDAVRTILKECHVLEGSRVCLTMTADERRILEESSGKQNGLVQILDWDRSADGDRQRVLIVTDAWRAEETDIIGTQAALQGIGMAAVFETLRRRCANLPIGCICGESMILPVAVGDGSTQAGRSDFTVEPIGDTGYAYYRAAEPVALWRFVQAALATGHIRVLIGGADELVAWGTNLSSVRTLVIVSRRVDFPAVVELRGRILQSESGDPNKVAQIWHMATVERHYITAEHTDLRLALRMESGDRGRGDFEMDLLRRYSICFAGPNTSGSELVSGFVRVEAPRTVAHSANADSTKKAARERSVDRLRVAEQWRHILHGGADKTGANPSRDWTLRTVHDVYVPKTARLPAVTPAYMIGMLLSIAAIVVFIVQMDYVIRWTYILWVLQPNSIYFTILAPIGVALAMVGAVVFVLHYLPLIARHLTARHSIRIRCKAVFKTMKALGMLDKDAVFVMKTAPKRYGYRVSVHGCNIIHQVAFQMAVAEMFSPIENPRYLMVRAGLGRRLLWRWSCACPSIIAKNDIAVKTFSRYVGWAMGRVKFQYTHREVGYRYLFFARHSSYLTMERVHCKRSVRQVWTSAKRSKPMQQKNS